MALSPDIEVVYPTISTGATFLNINGAFGWNLVSLYDNNNTGVKMVLQLFKDNFSTKIAEIRQYPNLSGYCHFDIRRILENCVDYTDGLEVIDNYLNNTLEDFKLQIKAGYENTSGQAVVIPWYMNALSQFRIIPARKNFYDLTLDTSSFITTAQYYNSDTASFTGYSNSMNPITNRDFTHILKNKEDFTITLSPATFVTNDGDNDGYYGPSLRTFYNRHQFYLRKTDNTYVYGSVITNTNTISLFTSYQMGYSNSVFKPYFDNGTIAEVFLVVSGTTGIVPAKTYSFTVDLEDDCRDYEPVQVSWINSYGFRDYFTFQKRWEKSINVTKNTYKKLLGNWGGGLMTIPSYDRGDKVFSQNGSESITLSTKFLEDNEAEFLKNLYLSPDVKIKFRDETNWTPVVLQDQTWTQRTFRKDKYFQYTINLKYSNDINTQK